MSALAMLFLQPVAEFLDRSMQFGHLGVRGGLTSLHFLFVIRALRVQHLPNREDRRPTMDKLFLHRSNSTLDIPLLVGPSGLKLFAHGRHSALKLKDLGVRRGRRLLDAPPLPGPCLLQLLSHCDNRLSQRVNFPPGGGQRGRVVWRW
jgi:hypothetical protein